MGQESLRGRRGDSACMSRSQLQRHALSPRLETPDRRTIHSEMRLGMIDEKRMKSRLRTSANQGAPGGGEGKPPLFRCKVVEIDRAYFSHDASFRGQQSFRPRRKLGRE